ncbi:MAG TPA: ATP-binding cassette domain-containing protein [Phycisphaerales bacterium]|nr:ATP-binding cassette domain-containing protein [Phycisphaerales bacterium]
MTQAATPSTATPNVVRPSTPSSRQSAGADAVVVSQNLTKVFKDFWMRDRARAVNTLNFEIRPREVFGLLGPNGSGKSTTIKMILGLLKPTSGRVAVFGHPPSDVSIKRRIGYLPEESYLYGFLNARETLEYYAKLFELDHRTRTRRIDELLDMLGLTGAQFRPVREYSKGMQRRIGIAQALINDPDFLILDEPTTGLDPIGTKQIKDLIIELGRRGKTILLSSHLLADVEDCVDRLIILYGGQKRAEGTCDELLVAQDRTAIEAGTLDEGTIAAIDNVIRQRTGSENAILRVSKPRQSLEELFLQIVEQAKAEQVSTSGATAGGETASFLKGEGVQGEALIDQLMRSEPAPAAMPVEGKAAEPAPAQVQKDVISDLLKEPEPAAQPLVRDPRTPAAEKAKAGDVDLSVIGSLLDDGKDSGGKERLP